MEDHNSNATSELKRARFYPTRFKPAELALGFEHRVERSVPLESVMKRWGFEHLVKRKLELHVVGGCWRHQYILRLSWGRHTAWALAMSEMGAEYKQGGSLFCPKPKIKFSCLLERTVPAFRTISRKMLDRTAKKNLGRRCASSVPCLRGSILLSVPSGHTTLPRHTATVIMPWHWSGQEVRRGACSWREELRGDMDQERKLSILLPRCRACCGQGQLCPSPKCRANKGRCGRCHSSRHIEPSAGQRASLDKKDA